MKKIVTDAKELLVSRSGAGNDFLGWIDLPVAYDKEEFARIKKAAEKIRNDSEVSGGDRYRRAPTSEQELRLNFCTTASTTLFQKRSAKLRKFILRGNSISSTYVKHLIDVIGDRDFSVNVISKSGTTTEPAIAFRIFKEMLEKKYGKAEASKRIYATTDKARGALKVWRRKKDMRLSLFRMMWADASLC